jgi:RecJ-like exonuclease
MDIYFVTIDCARCRGEGFLEFDGMSTVTCAICNVNFGLPSDRGVRQSLDCHHCGNYGHERCIRSRKMDYSDGAEGGHYQCPGCMPPNMTPCTQCGGSGQLYVLCGDCGKRIPKSDNEWCDKCRKVLHYQCLPNHLMSDHGPIPSN